MPWYGSGRNVYSAQIVGAVAPADAGVYALFNDGKWIYIGESLNIRDRLLQHLRDSHSECIKNAAPQYFAWELTANRVLRQDQLILEMHPTCNQRLG
jgi:excinuclease UvrABC nuclease subunit